MIANGVLLYSHALSPRQCWAWAPPCGLGLKLHQSLFGLSHKICTIISACLQAAKIVGERFCGWAGVRVPPLEALPGYIDGQFRIPIFHYQECSLGSPQASFLSRSHVAGLVVIWASPLGCPNGPMQWSLSEPVWRQTGGCLRLTYFRE